MENIAVKDLVILHKEANHIAQLICCNQLLLFEQTLEKALSLGSSTLYVAVDSYRVCSIYIKKDNVETILSDKDIKPEIIKALSSTKHALSFRVQLDLLRCLSTISPRLFKKLNGPQGPILAFSTDSQNAQYLIKHLLNFAYIEPELFKQVKNAYAIKTEAELLQNSTTLSSREKSENNLIKI